MEERWREPAALAEQYAGMLYRLAYARTGSRADAEDVMQEVFVRLLRARPEFRDEEHAKAWLLRVGARCAADVLRAPWRRREGPLDDGLPAPEPPGEGGVVEAVLALPAQYRMAVHLYYYEELSVAEIAAVLGKSEGAVKSRLFRARALLRRYLKEDAAQETLLRAWQRYGTFRGEAAERTWITAIALNVCRDLLRSPWHTHRMELSALAEPAAEDAPWDDTPLRAVLSLPRKYREVVLLRYYEEFTLEEIADTLGIVPGTVSARLTRAKRKLRPMLEEWYYD